MVLILSTPRLSYAGYMKKHYCSVVMTSAALLLAFRLGAEGAPPWKPSSNTLRAAVDVGTTTQLAVSPKIIAQTGAGLKRTMGRPSDLHTVISADAPWEQGFAIGVLGTSIVDSGGGHLQLWYSLRNRTLVNNDVDWGGSSSDTGHRILQAYAVSSDFGRSWEKPLLHRFRLGNSSANNIVGYIHNFGVPSHGGLNTVTIFADPHSSVDKRYRGISSPIYQTNNVTYVNHSYSADGLNWTASAEPWTMSGIASGWEASGGADTQLSAFWDPSCAPPSMSSPAAGAQMGCYTLYNRFDKNSPLPKPFFRMVRRNRATSLDADNGQGDWNLYPEEIVMAADTIDNRSHPAENAASPPVDYYGATVWVDRSGMYWMAAVRNWHWDNGPYAWEGNTWKPGGQPLGSYDIALAMSVDGSHFELLGERRPWAQPSRDGTVGSRRLWLASPGPVASGNQSGADLHVFFTRSNTAELGAGAIDPALAVPEWLSEIVVGTLRTDGLAAIEAPYGTAAVLTTKALTFPRDTELILNLDTGGGSGSLVVIVKAALNGSTLATSTPISANAVELAVRGWMPGSKSIASLSGTPVTMEFHLSSCLFYSFRFFSRQQQIKSDDDTHGAGQQGFEPR